MEELQIKMEEVQIKTEDEQITNCSDIISELLEMNSTLEKRNVTEEDKTNIKNLVTNTLEILEEEISFEEETDHDNIRNYVSPVLNNAIPKILFKQFFNGNKEVLTSILSINDNSMSYFKEFFILCYNNVYPYVEVDKNFIELIIQTYLTEDKKHLIESDDFKKLLEIIEQGRRDWMIELIN